MRRTSGRISGKIAGVRQAAILALAAVCAHGANMPMTVVTEDEAYPIYSAITRKEAWTQESVRRLRADAERRMKEGPWSVTTERPLRPDLDPHDYYSEAPYWWPDMENPSGPFVLREGHTNPGRFIENQAALISMSDGVFALGLAAYMFDEPRYAQRAARLVQTWFLNPRTRMNPNLEHAEAVPGIDTGRSAGIIEGRAFIRALQGIEFLEGSDYWEEKDAAAVRRWFADYLHWLTQSHNGLEEKDRGTYHASWWTAQVAAIASFLGDQAVMKMAFAHYQDRVLPAEIRPNGSAPREEMRGQSLTLSVLNAQALAITCRIAEVHGVDLWHTQTRRGASMDTVVAYLSPYLAEPRKWPHEQIGELPNDSLDFLAFAGMGLKKPEYLQLFQKLEKPEGAWMSLVDLMVGRWQAAGHQTRH